MYENPEIDEFILYELRRKLSEMMEDILYCKTRNTDYGRKLYSCGEMAMRQERAARTRGGGGRQRLRE